MWWRAAVAGLIVAAVSEVAGRYPRLGGLLLTLPVTSIVAFLAVWQKDRDVDVIAGLARETLVLVPLRLQLFVPLALAPKLGLSFWPALGIGLVMASATISAWFTFAPAAE